MPEIPPVWILGGLLTPLSPAANSLFSAKVTVKNQGMLAGDGGYLDLWTNSATVRAGRPGTKTLRAFVDSWCETSEPNEANNKRAKVYTVK